MAESLSRAFGDALVALLDWGWPHVGQRVESAAEHLAEIVRPHPPMSIITLDGQTLTGLLVADRGQVLAFIGTRQAAPSRAPLHHDYYEGPLWSHDPHG